MSFLPRGAHSTIIAEEPAIPPVSAKAIAEDGAMHITGGEQGGQAPFFGSSPNIKRHSVSAKASPRQVASDGREPGLILALLWARPRLAGGVLRRKQSFTQFIFIGRST